MLEFWRGLRSISLKSASWIFKLQKAGSKRPEASLSGVVRRFWVVGVCWVVGCGPTAQQGSEQGPDVGIGSGSPDSAEASTGDASGAKPGPDLGVASGFIGDPEAGGPPDACSSWEQDCPPGQKCNVWAKDGANAWNATKCVPVEPDADEAGEPCRVTESGVSGLDSCQLGAVCWDVDPVTMLGRCVDFCTAGL